MWPDWVVGCDQNQWSDATGLGGRIRPEYAEKPAFEIVKSKKKIYIERIVPHINYPYLLNPGQKLVVHIPTDRIIKQLVDSGYSNSTKIRATYKTATNKKFKCRKTLSLLDLKKINQHMAGEKVSRGVPNGIY